MNGMSIPGSAADLPKEKTFTQSKQEEIICALVKGNPMYFTRKEAFTLASMLLISLEVECNATEI